MIRITYGATILALVASLHVRPHCVAPKRSGVRCHGKNRLYLDQQAAMERRADVERGLLEPNACELADPVLTKPKKPKAKKAKKGTGFGGARVAAALPTAPLSASEELVEGRAGAIARDGVILVRGALKSDTAARLRSRVLDVIESGRSAVREAADPIQVSLDRFYVEQEQPHRAFVLLPFRDDASDAAGVDGPAVDAMRELVAPGAPLGDLWEQLCGGDDAVLYDFYALRTDPGSIRQSVRVQLARRREARVRVRDEESLRPRRISRPLSFSPPPPFPMRTPRQLHFDTPHQAVPPLFAAFIALQDVTPQMGPTTFLPGTHKPKGARRVYDEGQRDGRRDEMLASAPSRYALLNAGDMAIFDMRTLHCGTANLDPGGATRIMLCVTFRNPRALEELGHLPCIRAGFKLKYTLADVRHQLTSSSPFASFGDGLPK